MSSGNKCPPERGDAMDDEVANTRQQTGAARRAMGGPLDEVLAPLREEFERSGMSEDELVQLLEAAKHDVRRRDSSRVSESDDS